MAVRVFWGYRTISENSRDIEELKKPIHAYEGRLPSHKDIDGFLQVGDDLIEAKAHVDDARDQHDGEDSVDE